MFVLLVCVCLKEISNLNIGDMLYFLDFLDFPNFKQDAKISCAGLS